MKSVVKNWLPLLLLIMLAGAAYASGLHHVLSFETIQARQKDLLALKSEYFMASIIFFLLVYIACVALSLPIATILTLLGGFLYGKWLGTVIVVAGATIGATLLFLSARTSLGAALRKKAGTAYQKLQGNMQENAVSYLLFLRLVPVFPFWLVNIVPALLNVSLPVFVLTTFFGIIPGSFIYVNLGEELGGIEGLSDLVSPGLLLALGFLGLFALIPVIYKQLKRKPAHGR